MAYALVTINYTGLEDSELKIPLDITAGELIDVLAGVYGDGTIKSKRIQAEPLGRILDNTKTLSEEGVSTGSLLTFI